MRISSTWSLPILVVAVASQATVLHVCPDGSGDSPNLHSAVATAVSGDVIELCDGVFTGLENVEVDVGDKSLTFRSLHGYEATTIDASILNVEHDEYWPYVAFILGPGSSTRIEGISIVGASNVDHTSWEDYGDGGAIRCLGASLVLDRVRIEGPYRLGGERGGGVFVESGALLATDCDFHWNRASYGAAIYAGGVADLRGCTFLGNGACIGAVVELQQGGTVEDCLFQGSGGAATACHSDSDPGGRALSIAGGPATVLRSRFLDNHSASGRTGISSGAPDLLVEDCSFEDCTSSYGSGSGITRGTIRRCRFIRHYASNDGGVLACGTGPVLLDGCVFVQCRNATSNGRTWGTVGVSGSATIQQCTFVGTTSGSDLKLESGATVILDRTIVAFASGSGDRVVCSDRPGDVAVSCTDIFANEGGDWVGCLSGLESGAGNFAADPHFCDLQSGDLTLRGQSPCAPEHSGDCGQIGAYGVGCGTTAIRPTNWGRVKGMYR